MKSLKIKLLYILLNMFFIYLILYISYKNNIVFCEVEDNYHNMLKYELYSDLIELLKELNIQNGGSYSHIQGHHISHFIENLNIDYGNTPILELKKLVREQFCNSYKLKCQVESIFWLLGSVVNAVYFFSEYDKYGLVFVLQVLKFKELPTFFLLNKFFTSIQTFYLFFNPIQVFCLIMGCYFLTSWLSFDKTLFYTTEIFELPDFNNNGIINKKLFSNIKEFFIPKQITFYNDFKLIVKFIKYKE